MQPERGEEAAKDVVGEIEPDESGADECGTDKGAANQLQKGRMPKLKGFEDAGDNEDPYADAGYVFSVGYEKERNETPEDLVEQACTVIVEPHTSGAGVKFEPKAQRRNEAQRKNNPLPRQKTA